MSDPIGPFFVVGNSRSGTTMLGRMLSKHPDVFTFHEIHFFEKMWIPHERNQYLNRQQALEVAANLVSIEREGYLKKRKPELYLSEAEQIVSVVQSGAIRKIDVYHAFLKFEANHNSGLIACEQTPRNLYYVEEIIKYFPDAKFINMVRDPRDVLLSQKNKWKRRFLGGGSQIPFFESLRSWVNYHPYIISRLWHSALITALKQDGQAHFQNVYFEDLVIDPEGCLKKICNYLGVDFFAPMLDIPKVGSSQVEDEPGVKRVDASRVGVWKKGGLTDAEIYICQKVNDDLMGQFGYEIVDVQPQVLKLVVSFFLLPIQLAAMLILNVRRYKNLFNTIKTRLFQN